MTDRVLVAMSGGVDSAAAAASLKAAGYSCAGAVMRLLRDAPGDDAADARRAADALGMEFFEFTLSDEFEREVITGFVRAYEKGLTPNPCIECNRRMKLGMLYEKAAEAGFSRIATGHYARTEYSEEYGRWLLKKAACAAKDQSYVLYFMSQEQLSRTLFPLGEFSGKDEVRALAERLVLPVSHKPESQDICFIPDGDYAGFIERYTGKTCPRGNFVDVSGKVIGEHLGVIRYTIGQRKGIGTGFGERMYVRSKDAVSNTVCLCRDEELYSDTLTAGEFNWILYDEPPASPAEVTARVRYNGKELPAEAYALPDGTVRVDFYKPQRAAAPGQSVVLYKGDIVVGGGKILTVGQSGLGD